MLRKLNILSKLLNLGAVFGLLVLTCSKSYSQIGPEALRAHWLMTLAEYVEWPDEEHIEKYTVGVYGLNAPEVEALINSAAEQRRKFKEKDYEVIHFKKLKDITPTHILYVNPSYNNDLPIINDKLKGENTLVVTYGISDKSTLQEYFMFNILLEKRDRQFTVNSKKAEEAGLIIPDKVLARGGTMVDLQNLNENKDKELQEKENMLQLQEQELQQKDRELTAQSLTNDIQKEQNLINKYELENKEKEIDSQKLKADQLLRDAQNLRRVLEDNNVLLRKQENEISEKQQQLNLSSEQLRSQQERISEREKQIDEHEKLLQKQSGQIDRQQRIILYASIFSGIIVILVIITTLSSLSRKRKNRQLAKLNDEVDRQKDHIEAQSRQLLQINKELEKLSIVAAQTDNGVVIMDSLGNIEWVNRGFTNMYGFAYNDLQNSKRDTLTGFYSTNEDITEIKNECLKTKESKVYETEIQTKDGKYIWTQSTLTPILDENNEITRLVTIDTDITQIKEQENAILAQGLTLAAQRDELAQQKEFIEEQNSHINTSLTYAKTIQETVMPLEVNITKCYKYFSLFIPLQIVSGDFYWFTRIPDDENMAFTAAVDCTGHGVPGAFMCMISTRLLNEIIVEHKIYDTKEILNSLNTGLVAALKQDTTDNNDSLEICLCKTVRRSDGDYDLTFSGAKRPLYVYRDKTGEFESLKADRKTIGGIMSKRNNTEFTSTEIRLQKNDKVYMTTDGFVNQFDKNNKKYGSDKFVNLLKSICGKDFKEQREILEKEYYDYKGEVEQNDDITIFGIQMI
jgi:PAS domain S-box-containing protein